MFYTLSVHVLISSNPFPPSQLRKKTELSQPPPHLHLRKELAVCAMSSAAAAVLATPFANSFVRPEEIMLK